MRSGTGTAVRAAASTLAACGVVVLAPAVAGMTSSRGWGICGVVALAIATLLALAPQRRPSTPARPRSVLAAVTRPAVGRAASILVACAGLGLAGMGLLAIRSRLQQSWTGPLDALPPLAGLFLLVGAGTLAWAGALAPTPPLSGLADVGGRGWRGAGIALVLVAALTTGAATVVPALAIDASTVEPATPPARVTRVGAGPLRVAWSRTVQDADSVIAGARGPLLAIGDGVVALDGTTGANLWHYRVPGIHVQVAASRDGRTVVLRVLGDRRPRSQAARMLVLDGATGRVRVDRVISVGHNERWTDSAEADEIQVGSTAVVTEALGYQVSRSLTDGRLLWQRDVNTEFCDTHRRVAMIRDVLVQAFTCKEDHEADVGWVMGTDPETGRTQWQRTTRADSIADAVLSVASDDSAVAVTLLATVDADKAATAGRGWAVVPADSALWLLDPVTGSVLYAANPRTAETIRALGAGWWMTGPWSFVVPGPAIEYTLGSPAGRTRNVLTAEGECLASRAVVFLGGWICQPVRGTRPTGYLVIRADPARPAVPAVPIASGVSGDAWLDDVPGALIAWTPSGDTVTALRWG